MSFGTGQLKKVFQTGSIVIAGIVLVANPYMYAGAHASPSGCNSNSLDVSIIKNKTQVYRGDTLTYTIMAANLSSGSEIACDVTDADINVTLPALDGTPTGQVVNITTAQDFPAGTTQTILDTVDYVVEADPSVVDIVAELRAEGVLHDAPADHLAQVVKTLGTTVVADEAPDDTGDSTPSLPDTSMGK